MSSLPTRVSTSGTSRTRGSGVNRGTSRCRSIETISTSCRSASAAARLKVVRMVPPMAYALCSSRVIFMRCGALPEVPSLWTVRSPRDPVVVPFRPARGNRGGKG